MPASEKAEETLFFDPAALAEEAPAEDLKDVLDSWFNPPAETEPEEAVTFKSAPQIEEAPAEDLKDVLAAWFSEPAAQEVPAAEESAIEQPTAAEELPGTEAERAEETFFFEPPSEGLEGTPEGLDAILPGWRRGACPRWSCRRWMNRLPREPRRPSSLRHQSRPKKPRQRIWKHFWLPGG